MVWINDPHDLTEPLVRTSDYVENRSQQIAPYPCQVVTEVERAMGVVPHHLPGTNPFLNEFHVGGACHSRRHAVAPKRCIRSTWTR
jgi:hypothetical protein